MLTRYTFSAQMGRGRKYQAGTVLPLRDDEKERYISLPKSGKSSPRPLKANKLRGLGGIVSRLFMRRKE